MVLRLGRWCARWEYDRAGVGTRVVVVEDCEFRATLRGVRARRGGREGDFGEDGERGDGVLGDCSRGGFERDGCVRRGCGLGRRRFVAGFGGHREGGFGVEDEGVVLKGLRRGWVGCAVYQFW